MNVVKVTKMNFKVTKVIKEDKAMLRSESSITRLLPYNII